MFPIRFQEHDRFIINITKLNRKSKESSIMSVRVKVCLSKIFKDHRQEAFVNVDSNCVRVINFEDHIRKLFSIKSSIYLTIGGCLLPSQESVHVIHSGDVIMY